MEDKSDERTKTPTTYPRRGADPAPHPPQEHSGAQLMYVRAAAASEPVRQ